MAVASDIKRPSLQPTDTFDAAHLRGTLKSNGVAALQAQPAFDRDGTGGLLTPGSVADNEIFGPGSTGTSDFAPSDSDDVIESYDDLQVDPNALVANAMKSVSDAYRPAHMSTNDGVSEIDGRNESSKRARHKKGGSIEIRLERTGKRGRYVLTADDPDIKEILRKGLERQDLEARGRKPRLHFRDLVFTRQFTTFDRQNPTSSDSAFFGFFTLFWICMLFVFCQMAMRNYRDYGSILGPNQIMNMMFSRDVLVLGATDGFMCALTFQGYFFQLAVQRGYVNWGKVGWIVQNFWQSAYLASIVGWAYFREWPWTHAIFAVLHGLVFLMKQHSYAFYNGYLSGVYKRKALLQRKLKQLEAMEPLASPTSPRESTQFDFNATGSDLTKQHENDLLRRRSSMGPRTSTNLAEEHSDVAAVAAAIESGSSINAVQMQTFSEIIHLEINELDKELRGKSTDEKNAYPNNLRLGNFAEFICLPTLVYELEYPRQDKINWWYVLEKTTATFGVLCVMQVISQAFIYPLVAKTVAMKNAGMTLEERWQEFPFIVSDMLFPLLIEQLLTWYLIWECILNVLAELTCFADRGFYGDWWNSVTWDQYARDWNRPVHNFLLRHVYHSSISTFHLSRNAATFVTFLLSALVHEMCMAIMFKKIRGYLFWLQLLQMPLVAFSRGKLMRGRVILGNTMFWLGLFIGPSVLTCLYLVV